MQTSLILEKYFTTGKRTHNNKSFLLEINGVTSTVWLAQLLIKAATCNHWLQEKEALSTLFFSLRYFLVAASRLVVQEEGTFVVFLGLNSLTLHMYLLSKGKDFS